MGEAPGFAKLYAITALGVLAAYIFVESRGIIFSATDQKSVPVAWDTSSGGRRSTGFFGSPGGFSGGGK